MSLSPAFTTALSILPQALLPLSIILSLSLLPFKGRGILCTVVIASIVYLTFVSPWPSEAQMRYGIMNSWFYYLPVVQKLICGVPEEEVWRVGARSHGGRIDRKREADEVTGTEKEALEMGFGWKKIQWAAELYANPRGVGWNFIVKSIPPPKYTNSQRTRFLIHQVAGFCLSYLLVDAGIAFVNAYGVENALNGSWRDRFVVGSAYALVIRSNWKLMWYFWSLIGVGIGVSRPANWPSLFGSLGDCTTVGGFWGRYWQGILHHCILGYSKALIRILRIPNHTTWSYLTHLSTGFFISGFFHALALGNLKTTPPVPKSYLYRQNLVFFMAQIVGIVIEMQFLNIVDSLETRVEEIRGEIPRQSVVRRRMKQILGWCWVCVWLLWTGWGFFEAYFRMGMLDWKVPFSFVEMAVSWGKDLVKDLKKW